MFPLSQPVNLAHLLILPFSVFPLYAYTRLVKGHFLILHRLSGTLSLTKSRHSARCHPSNHHHYHHQSLNRKGRWGTTDDFSTSFLHLSLFSTALWDLPNSRPVHSPMLSSHIFLCPPCLLPPFSVPSRWFWPDLMKGKHDHTTAVCVSFRSSGDLHVVQWPAGSWHGLPRW